jgi:hypothetical protein
VKLQEFVQRYQFLALLESDYQQKLAWKDAAEARTARRKAEEQARAQLEAMLKANPSGQLGRAKLNDVGALIRSGLL